MFERTSPLCTNVILDALKWSVKLGVPLVRNEHFLLSLSEHETILQKYLLDAKITTKTIFDMVDGRVPKAPPDWAGIPLTFAKDSRLTLQTAQTVRNSLSHDYLYADHISIALLDTFQSFFDELNLSSTTLSQSLIECLEMTMTSTSDHELSVPSLREDRYLESISVLYNRDPTFTTLMLNSLSLLPKDLPQ